MMTMLQVFEGDVSRVGISRKYLGGEGGEVGILTVLFLLLKVTTQTNRCKSVLKSINQQFNGQFERSDVRSCDF